MVNDVFANLISEHFPLVAPLFVECWEDVLMLMPILLAALLFVQPVEVFFCVNSLNLFMIVAQIIAPFGVTALYLNTKGQAIS